MQCMLEFTTLLWVVLVLNQVRTALIPLRGGSISLGKFHSSINHPVIFDNITFYFFMHIWFRKSQLVSKQTRSSIFFSRIQDNTILPPAVLYSTPGIRTTQYSNQQFYCPLQESRQHNTQTHSSRFLSRNQDNTILQPNQQFYILLQEPGQHSIPTSSSIFFSRNQDNTILQPTVLYSSPGIRTTQYSNPQF